MTKTIVVAILLVVGSATAVTGIAAAPGNEPPLADAGLDQTVTDGATVLLDGTGSRDPDGEIVGYRWTVTAPDGSAVTPACPTCGMTEFPTNGTGTYEVRLTVTDDDGASRSDTLYVTVEPADEDDGNDDSVDTPSNVDTTENGDERTERSTSTPATTPTETPAPTPMPTPTPTPTPTDECAGGGDGESPSFRGPSRSTSGSGTTKVVTTTDSEGCEERQEVTLTLSGPSTIAEACDPVDANYQAELVGMTAESFSWRGVDSSNGKFADATFQTEQERKEVVLSVTATLPNGETITDILRVKVECKNGEGDPPSVDSLFGETTGELPDGSRSVFGPGDIGTSDNTVRFTVEAAHNDEVAKELSITIRFDDGESSSATRSVSNTDPTTTVEAVHTYDDLPQPNSEKEDVIIRREVTVIVEDEDGQTDRLTKTITFQPNGDEEKKWKASLSEWSAQPFKPGEKGALRIESKNEAPPEITLDWDDGEVETLDIESVTRYKDSYVRGHTYNEGGDYTIEAFPAGDVYNPDNGNRLEISMEKEEEEEEKNETKDNSTTNEKSTTKNKNQNKKTSQTETTVTQDEITTPGPERSTVTEGRLVAPGASGTVMTSGKTLTTQTTTKTTDTTTTTTTTKTSDGVVTDDEITNGAAQQSTVTGTKIDPSNKEEFTDQVDLNNSDIDTSTTETETSTTEVDTSTTNVEPVDVKVDPSDTVDVSDLNSDIDTSVGIRI